MMRSTSLEQMKICTGSSNMVRRQNTKRRWGKFSTRCEYEKVILFMRWLQFSFDSTAVQLQLDCRLTSNFSRTVHILRCTLSLLKRAIHVQFQFSCKFHIVLTLVFNWQVRAVSAQHAGEREMHYTTSDYIMFCRMINKNFVKAYSESPLATSYQWLRGMKRLSARVQEILGVFL